MRKILLTLGVIAPLIIAGKTYAISTTPSDYDQDVTAGQDQLKNDQDAKKQADQVNGNESEQAEVDNSDTPIDQTVDDQEAITDDNQSGEAVHGDSNSGQSDSSDNQNSQTNDSTDNGSQNAQGEAQQ